MSTKKLSRIFLLFALSTLAASQELVDVPISSNFGQVAINCNGKIAVCVGPLMYKDCVIDSNGKMYASGSAKQCPTNSRCINNGVAICVPIKTSTEAPATKVIPNTTPSIPTAMPITEGGTSDSHQVLSAVNGLPIVQNENSSAFVDNTQKAFNIPSEIFGTLKETEIFPEKFILSTAEPDLAIEKLNDRVGTTVSANELLLGTNTVPFDKFDTIEYDYFNDVYMNSTHATATLEPGLILETIATDNTNMPDYMLDDTELTNNHPFFEETNTSDTNSTKETSTKQPNQDGLTTETLNLIPSNPTERNVLSDPNPVVTSIPPLYENAENLPEANLSAPVMKITSATTAAPGNLEVDSSSIASNIPDLESKTNTLTDPNASSNSNSQNEIYSNKFNNQNAIDVTNAVGSTESASLVEDATTPSMEVAQSSPAAIDVKVIDPVAPFHLSMLTTTHPSSESSATSLTQSNSHASGSSNSLEGPITLSGENSQNSPANNNPLLDSNATENPTESIIANASADAAPANAATPTNVSPSRPLLPNNSMSTTSSVEPIIPDVQANGNPPVNSNSLTEHNLPVDPNVAESQSESIIAIESAHPVPANPSTSASGSMSPNPSVPANPSEPSGLSVSISSVNPTISNVQANSNPPVNSHSLPEHNLPVDPNVAESASESIIAIDSAHPVPTNPSVPSGPSSSISSVNPTISNVKASDNTSVNSNSLPENNYPVDPNVADNPSEPAISGTSAYPGNPIISASPTATPEPSLAANPGAVSEPTISISSPIPVASHNTSSNSNALPEQNLPVEPSILENQNDSAIGSTSVKPASASQNTLPASNAAANPSITTETAEPVNSGASTSSHSSINSNPMAIPSGTVPSNHLPDPTAPSEQTSPNSNSAVNPNVVVNPSTSDPQISATNTSASAAPNVSSNQMPDPNLPAHSNATINRPAGNIDPNATAVHNGQNSTGNSNKSPESESNESSSVEEKHQEKMKKKKEEKRKRKEEKIKKEQEKKKKKEKPKKENDFSDKDESKETENKEKNEEKSKKEESKESSNEREKDQENKKKKEKKKSKKKIKEEDESSDKFESNENSNEEGNKDTHKRKKEKHKKHRRDRKEKKNKDESNENSDEQKLNEKNEALIQDIIAKLRDQNCNEGDTFSDVKDCKKYYRCVERSGKMKLVHFHCERKKRFDFEERKCVKKNKAHCLLKAN